MEEALKAEISTPSNGVFGFQAGFKTRLMNWMVGNCWSSICSRGRSLGAMLTAEDGQVFCFVTGNIDSAVYNTKRTLD